MFHVSTADTPHSTQANENKISVNICRHASPLHVPNGTKCEAIPNIAESYEVHSRAEASYQLSLMPLSLYLIVWKFPTMCRKLDLEASLRIGYLYFS